MTDRLTLLCFLHLSLCRHTPYIGEVRYPFLCILVVIKCTYGALIQQMLLCQNIKKRKTRRLICRN